MSRRKHNIPQLPEGATAESRNSSAPSRAEGGKDSSLSNSLGILFAFLPLLALQLAQEWPRRMPQVHEAIAGGEMHLISTVSFLTQHRVCARLLHVLGRKQGGGEEKEDVLAEPAAVALSEVVLPAACLAEVGNGGQFGVQRTAWQRKTNTKSQPRCRQPATHARIEQRRSCPIQIHPEKTLGERPWD